MKSLSIEELRALIRLIAPARALLDELEKGLHLETYEGMGLFAVRSYHGLQQSIYSITEDPYVEALEVDVTGEEGDKYLVAQIVLAASQLLAYLEGQAGISGLTGRQHYSIQTAPNITLRMDSFTGSPEETERIMETIDRAVRFQTPRPPQPMRPPQPERPERPQRPPMPPEPPGFHVQFNDEDDNV